MKPTYLFTIFLALILAGAGGLFYYQQTLPDTEHINQDVTERLLKIDSYDANVSELALRSRFNLDSNYDALTRATLLLDKEIEDFADTYLQDASMQGSLIEKRFNEYRSELSVKMELIENFKSHNSVLRNSEKYLPVAGLDLQSIATNEKLAETAALYDDIVKNLLEYSLLGTPATVERLKLKMPRLAELEENMPEYATTAMIEFTNHANTVIREKEETDRYLSKALTSTSDNSLDNLSKAWGAWLIETNKAKEQFAFYVIGYIAFLVLAIAAVAWKLRNLYSALDHEVAVRTEEVKHAYEELKESESQLVQSEKMASLGQLMAGVAHEINTPLGYISSNVDTIRLNMGELDSILSSVDAISAEIASKQPDKKKLGLTLKRLVQSYREMRNRETLNEIEGLLKDSSYGLNEISELVGSLKDFSRLDRSIAAEADIHIGLNATIKICSNAIGQRQLVRDYDPKLPRVECLPAQLNQVFMNILTNASQATSEETGVIKITTKAEDQGIEITFEDNGKGMDAHTLEHIYDPFYTTKEVGEGTGLGMSISYKIIKSHGGEIITESEVGKGTRMTIQLPLKQSASRLSVIK